jgi:HEPN domain-containing protein
MPRERFEPDDPREWVARARGNIVIARNLIPGVELEDLCFNAQQAAEKALKAVLLKLGVDFPYTHDRADCLR